MSWTAIIPFKGSAERKTRLGSRLGTVERQWLSQGLFAHVVGVLRRALRCSPPSSCLQIK